MEIQDLRYFVTVAQIRNITKAAEQLFISRQALSKSLHKLEKECGSKLFLRKNDGLQITPLGLEVLEKTIPVLDSFAALEQTIHTTTRNKSKIRIAIGLGTMNSLSPRIFADFRRDHPEIELSIHEDCDEDVRKDLEMEQADIGILNSSPGKLTRFDAMLIQEWPILLQVSIRNPLSAKDRIVPKDLHGQSFVTLGERCDMHSVLVEHCYKVNAFPNFVLETIDSNVANHMVYNNSAISLSTPYQISEENSDMRVLPVDIGETVWGTFVIRRKDSEASAPTALLLDYLSNLTDCIVNMPGK